SPTESERDASDDWCQHDVPRRSERLARGSALRWEPACGIRPDEPSLQVQRGSAQRRVERLRGPAENVVPVLLRDDGQHVLRQLQQGVQRLLGRREVRAPGDAARTEGFDEWFE